MKIIVIVVLWLGIILFESISNEKSFVPTVARWGFGVLLPFLLGIYLFSRFGFWILGIAGAIGAPIGLYQGVKNYYQAIDDNINNDAFKYIMFVITSLVILLMIVMSYFIFVYIMEETGI